MATTDYGVNHALAVKLWARRLFSEALKQTRYEQFKGTTDSDSLISLRNETQKAPGDRVTVGLRMQLTGRGITGDGTLEGSEEALTTYSDNIFIDQLRHAVRSGGKMSEQRVPFSVREEAMAGLKDWWADRLDTSLFNQLAGATTQQTQGNAAQSTSIDNAYSGNQAATAPDANHIMICSAALDTTEASLSATTTFSLKLADIDRAVAKAKTLSPAIRPLNVDGQKMYVCFIHPYQTYQLRANTSTGQWQDIQKSILTGGKIGDNPIITGLLGTYNNTLLVEDSRVPCVASSVTSSTSYRRAIFCGAQAAAVAFGQDNGDSSVKWVEELFDYENQLGVSAGMIFGIKKMVFNSADFSTIVMSGYAPAV
jgi:N4-gp56 family major capsid protein